MPQTFVENVEICVYVFEVAEGKEIPIQASPLFLLFDVIGSLELDVSTYFTHNGFPK